MNVLILGVSNAQVDAIQYCKARGHCVHGLSHRREGRGLEWLDAFAVVDIKDKAAVAQYARQQGIALVYSVGSDLAMPTVSYVSRELGLPCFVDEATVALMKHKGAMREFLDRQGISRVPFQTGAQVDDFAGWRDFPAMMKPVDSQGQRGVFEVAGAEDIRRLFERSRSFSPTGTVIVEKRLAGQEISCNAFVHAGEVVYHILSDRETVPGYPGGIIQAHHVPCQLSDAAADRAVRLVERIIRALRIAAGPVYLQMKYDPAAGEIALIEMMTRLDGCHLWRLIRFKYGVDLLDLSFQVLMGAAPSFPAPAEALPGTLHLEFLHQKPATPFVPVPRDAACLHEEFFYKPGEVVRPVNTWSETVGYRIRR